MTTLGAENDLLPQTRGAKYLGVSRPFFADVVQRVVPAVHVGRRRLWRRSDLDLYREVLPIMDTTHLAHGYRKTDSDRFWAKVGQDGDCWIWTAGKSWDGYGYFHLGGGERRRIYAHRWSYEALVGDIPDGLQLDHLCRNRPCVNPYHLDPVDGRTNMLRGETVAAKRAAVTHCPAGHEYTPENTRRSSRGQRSCRACGRAYSVARAVRKREAREQTRKTA